MSKLIEKINSIYNKFPAVNKRSNIFITCSGEAFLYPKYENKTNNYECRDEKESSYDYMDAFFNELRKLKTDEEMLYIENLNKQAVFAETFTLMDKSQSTSISNKDLNHEVLDIIDLYKMFINTNPNTEAEYKVTESLSVSLLSLKMKDVFTIIRNIHDTYHDNSKYEELAFNLSWQYFDTVGKYSNLKDFGNLNNIEYISRKILSADFNGNITLKSFIRKKTEEIKKSDTREIIMDYMNHKEVDVFLCTDSTQMGTTDSSVTSKYRPVLDNIKKSKKRKLKSNVPSHKLEAFKEVFPNFSNFIEHIQSEIILNSCSDNFFSITPTLIVGEPGIGKTFILQQLSEALKVESTFLNAGTLTGGFILNGLSSGWSSGQPGTVFNSLYENKYANPLFILDEIDKVPSTEVSPVEPVFLSLLEKHSAKKFREEFWNFEIDASYINWLATANEKDLVSDPLLSRLAVFDIPFPTYKERQIFARQVFNKIVKDRRIEHLLKENVSDEVIQELARDEGSLRDIGRVLKMAIVSAIKRDRSQILLKPEDINRHSLSVNKPTIGFINSK